MKPFQMFEGGSMWLPPKMNPYMQKQLKEGSSKDGSSTNLTSRKQSLSERYAVY